MYVALSNASATVAGKRSWAPQDHKVEQQKPDSGFKLLLTPVEDIGPNDVDETVDNKVEQPVPTLETPDYGINELESKLSTPETNPPTEFDDVKYNCEFVIPI